MLIVYRLHPFNLPVAEHLETSQSVDMRVWRATQLLSIRVWVGINGRETPTSMTLTPGPTYY